MVTLEEIQNKTRDLEQLYTKHLEIDYNKTVKENSVLQEINNNFENTLQNKENELKILKEMSVMKTDFPLDLIEELKSAVSSKSKKDTENAIKQFKDFLAGNKKVNDLFKTDQLEEKCKKLEEENRNLKKSKSRTKIADLEKRNSELQREVERLKHADRENKELKEENRFLRETSNKSTKKDEAILMKQLMNEKETKIKQKDVEIEKLKSKINSLTISNDDFILPETSIAKNPYDKSFLMVQPKKEVKKRKKAKDEINTAEKILSKENKSFFQDLSFCHSSPAAISKNKYKK
ncbi:hypothetical protein NUSPORA_00607 [Nucleospora cyclopteri]